MRRVNSAKRASAGSNGSLGNTFRTGPRMIPMKMRKIKKGTSSFLEEKISQETDD
jgi:hypothetical protein